MLGRAGVMSAFYIGELVPATNMSDGVLVQAAVSSHLVPCTSALEPENDMYYLGPSQKRARPNAPPRDKYKHSYYVCTFNGCGWRGNSRITHRKNKPDCQGYPSKLEYVRKKVSGDSLKSVAAAFLARCTPRQREIGLPPDGAKPIPLPNTAGRIDPSVLYLTIPVGLAEGDEFVVPMSRGLEATITVPPGKSEGDVLCISAFGGYVANGTRAGDDDAPDQPARAVPPAIDAVGATHVDWLRTTTTRALEDDGASEEERAEDQDDDVELDEEDDG